LQQKNAAFLEKARKGMKSWNELMLKRRTANTTPMKPQVVAHELGRRLPSDAIVAGDSGTVTTWWARYIPSLRG
jgi:pyruvate dehydrogenase (quinone)